MVVELKLVPVGVLLEVAGIKLTEVEREPVLDEEAVSVIACVHDSGHVLPVVDAVAIFCHSEGPRAYGAISRLARLVSGFELVLLVMASLVPGVADPEYCGEQYIPRLLGFLEALNFCLNLIVCFDNLFF